MNATDIVRELVYVRNLEQEYLRLKQRRIVMFPQKTEESRAAWAVVQAKKEELDRRKPQAWERAEMHLRATRQPVSMETLQALASGPPKWIDDPHDVCQGRMLNPEWLQRHNKTPAQAVAEETEASNPATDTENINRGCRYETDLTREVSKTTNPENSG